LPHICLEKKKQQKKKKKKKIGGGGGARQIGSFDMVLVKNMCGRANPTKERDHGHQEARKPTNRPLSRPDLAKLGRRPLNAPVHKLSSAAALEALRRLREMIDGAQMGSY